MLHKSRKLMQINDLRAESKKESLRKAGLKYPLGESNPCCRTENPES